MAVRRSLICLFSSKICSSTSLVCKCKLNVNVSVSLYFSTSVDKEQPPVYEFLIEKHHFSPEAASRVASDLTHFNNPKKADSLLFFLKENGFSITQLEKIMRFRPRYLVAGLEKNIKPKITLFQDIGFSANEVAEIISNNPNILQYSIKNKIIPSLSVLKGILGSSVEVAKVLRKSSRILCDDLEKNLLPNIEILKSCGIAIDDILKQICLSPRFFLTNPEGMKKFVDKADKMGADRSSRMFIYVVKNVCSISNETLKLKFNVLQDLGFSEEDILRVAKHTPSVFSVSDKKMRKIKEVLLETKKYDVSCIVNNPTSLTYSVETRYKPRLQVLGILEKKNLIEKWPSLSELAITPDKKFCEKFVDPFSNELSDSKLMSKALCSASVLSHRETPQCSDCVLSYFEENGFSITQMEKLLRNMPKYLTSDLEKIIKPIITIFQDMGFSANEIADIISKNPGILQSSLKNKIIPSISILKGLMRGSTVEMARVLRKSSWVLRVDLEKNFMPNVKFLESCGIPMAQIISQIKSCPTFFLYKPESIKKFVDKADELGVHRSSKMFIYAVWMISSMSNDSWELKFKTFLDMGFSEDDILKVFRNAPLVFSVSIEKLRKVKEVLLETQKYDMSCIVNYPMLLTYSVEMRYKPRLEVLGILEKKNLLEKWPNLATLINMSNKKFCQKFVDPFSNELQDVKLLILSKSR